MSEEVEQTLEDVQTSLKEAVYQSFRSSRNRHMERPMERIRQLSQVERKMTNNYNVSKKKK